MTSRKQFRNGLTCGTKHFSWLGREDSNLRMAESKSAALPLGYAPIRIAPGMAQGAAEHNGPPPGDQ